MNERITEICKREDCSLRFTALVHQISKGSTKEDETIVSGLRTHNGGAGREIVCMQPSGQKQN